MVAIGVNSNQWAHTATRAPPVHVQRHTCTHGKKIAESSHYIYKERFHMIIVIGKWTSSQDLIVILINQLEETS